MFKIVPVGVCICVWLGVVCGEWETEGICIAQVVREPEKQTNFLAVEQNLTFDNSIKPLWLIIWVLI